MFQLSEGQVESMVSQNAIPSRKHLGDYLPYAFTEHGVLMPACPVGRLANVLKTETAMQVSVRIIEIFVKMRELLLSHKDILLSQLQSGKK